MNLHVPDVRTLEVHPAPWSTLRSTCRCSSGFEERSDLGVPLLIQAIADAANLGYNFLNVAGEEPLLYPGLQPLCRAAHRHGMLTTMTLNRTTPTAAQFNLLRLSIDMLGVAIDAHTMRPNRIRGVSRAAQTMERRLELVRRSGIPFAIVFTLTPDNLSDLEWAAEFAITRSAAMLQIRPSSGLSDEQMSTAWMLSECLSDLHRGHLAVHLDAVNRYNVQLEPDDLASWKKDLEREARYLGEIVSPLVIEDSGVVAPLRFGFPRRFAFGNLRDERLKIMTQRWIDTRAAEFCKVYGSALEQARVCDRTFGDLYDMFSSQVQRGPLGMSAAC